MRAAAAALVAVCLVAACDRAPRVEAIPRGETVVALGDSLTYGTGASAEAGYPAALSARTGWKVVNAGVPGETAAQGCARMPDLLAQHRPRLVLVLLGGNDFLRRLPESGVRAALARCVGAARSAGVQAVLLTVPKIGWTGLASADLYEEVGSQLGAPVVDSGLARLLGDRGMRSDRIHLNDEGYRVLAGNVADGLARLGLLAR